MKKKSSTFRGLRFIGTVIAATIIGGAAFYFGGLARTNKARFDAYISTPTAARFLDDASTVLYDSVPDVNNNRTITPQSYVKISYELASSSYGPAFKYDTSKSALNQSIKIRPAIRGTWVLQSPYELQFMPEQNWPAGTRFDVKIAPNLFAPDARPNTTKLSFTTAPIVAKPDFFNVYPIPGGDKSVIGVAAISFNYPISTKDFADKVSVRLDGKNVKFTVKFDRYLRTAIIQTEPIKITDSVQTLRLKLNRIPDADNKSQTEKITAKTVINSLDTFFKILDVSSISADDKTGSPQQLVLMQMSAAARAKTDWQKYVNIYLLPADHADQQSDEPHRWALDEITPNIIKQSKKLDTKLIDFVNPAGTYQYAFAYEVSDNVPRYIYVDIKPGINSENGFITKNGASMVLPVAYPPRTVKIAGNGALLSLAGDKTLGIVARGGVQNAYISLYKIESGEINHLITQTYNLFSGVDFRAPWTFDAYDMSVVFNKKIPFSNTSMTHVNYASLNLGEYLDRTYNDKTGIFIIKAGATETDAEFSDARLVLLTDLGIIRKINLDKSSTLFVSKISTGAPAGDVNISVLGRNGQPIWAGATDADGRTDIPRFAHDEYKNEKEPVAIVARQNSDIAFIPYYADTAQTDNHSKFDVGGIYASNTTPLQAMVFSDRGVYRSGETVIIGTIVENKSFTSVAETPVKIEITDPRRRTILDKKISLPANGMFDTTYKLATDAPLGQYNVDVYSLNKRGHIQESLGSVNFMVQEFMPDTMKISAQLAGTSQNGWIAPNNITANVSLNNLFATPATNRRITATATLRPTEFDFKEYRGYTFTQNVKNTTSEQLARKLESFNADIENQRTDDNGNATLHVDFNREIPTGTYMLTLHINGFDGGDGKSIQTALNARVSNLDYLVGYKPESDIGYIKRNDTRNIKFIAIDRDALPIALNDLTMRLIRREDLTSLIKDTTGQYKYQTVTRDKVIQESSFVIAKNGSDFALNTTKAGTYYIQISDKNNDILSHIEYFVAADENQDLNTTKSAELKIKLNAAEYQPGDTIDIQIVAPYSGTGLITIERDKVYAHKWFVADTTATTQRIRLPQDFEGTGYINVSFVRNITSRDVFTAPYTYAVAPFSTTLQRRKIDVKLNAPDVIRDNKLKIEYTTNQDAKLMLFAVNTGILQVANYKIPNPIKYFFQKAALQVETSQILSLLLPEYKILREVAKTGGGDFANEFEGLGAPLTNPFGRKTLPPVAFYSGILNAVKDTTNEITFDIPEYFNGELSIYAVAANVGAIGAADARTSVKSPVVISLSAPTFVAPNDKFITSAIISNLTPESGEDAVAVASAKTTGQLGTITPEAAPLELPENTEKLWNFDMVALSEPGTATIDIGATLFNAKGDAIATRDATATLSVRPITTHKTIIRSYTLTDKKTTIGRIDANMYKNGLSQNIFVSGAPAVLAYPLIMYLQDYEYSCSEQIVSRTLPYVLLPNNKLVGTTTQDSQERVAKAIQVLMARQNSDGSFGMWANNARYTDNINDAGVAYLSAYTMNFLTLARRAGRVVPQSMFARGIDFLRDLATQNTTSPEMAHAQALAIYVLTQNDYVTTSYIDSLQEYADANIQDWQSSIIGAYMAASYKMLKQADKAFDLISKYRTNFKPASITQFNNTVANDAVYTLIANKYFDMPPKTITKSIQNYINSGNYDSFTAATIVMALATTTSPNTVPNDITILSNDKKLKLDQGDNLIWTSVPFDTTKLRITCDTCDKEHALFATLVLGGFPKTARPESNGIEIVRTYYDKDGKEIDSGKIGDIVNIKIVARTLGRTDKIDNAVISDLLPGGFIPLSDTLTGAPEFSEIHEDRVLIYTSLSRTPTVFTYSAQMTVAGQFAVPPISASDMYNSGLTTTGTTGTFTVSNETH